MSWAARKALYAATALILGVLGITGIVTEDQAAILNSQVPEILIMVGGLVTAFAAAKTGRESDGTRVVTRPEPVPEPTEATPVHRRRVGLPIHRFRSSAPEG